MAQEVIKRVDKIPYEEIFIGIDISDINRIDEYKIAAFNELTGELSEINKDSVRFNQGFCEIALNERFPLGSQILHLDITSGSSRHRKKLRIVNKYKYL